MAQAGTIKVVVIYRNQVARAGLMAGFGQYRDIQVVQTGAVREECGSGESSGEEVADVVVADYDAGIAYMERSRAQSSLEQASKVMIVTASDGESDIRYALGRGARGYMLLDSDFDDLAHGVREVHMGVRALSRRIAQQLAEIVTAEGLSSREMEVLRYLVEGLGNKLIARRLNIAVETVKSHLKSIFEKLQVESRTQAIVVATRRGLLSHH